MATSYRTQALPALLRLSLRHFARARGRTLLTLAGLALGVATLVAIDVVNASSGATIDELVSAYAGRSTLSVRTAGTLSPSALPAVGRIPGVRAAAGTIQGALLVGGDARIPLPFIAGTGTGDDALIRDYRLADGALPGTNEVALGGYAARRLGLRTGDPLAALTPAGPAALRVSGLLDDAGVGRANGGFVAVLRHDVADRLYARGAGFDVVDVVTDTGADVARIADDIERAVPGADAQEPAQRGAQTKKLVASLQSLLQVVSALSLFVGSFLVFNTMSVAVAQRRRELGILRSLGARRADIVRAILVEALALGAVGSIAGAIAGVTLAQGLLGLVNQQIRQNFVAGLADQLVVSGDRLGALLLVGMAAAILGAIVPALSAAGATPAEAMAARPRGERIARAWRYRLLLAAVVLVALSVFAVLAQREADDAGPGSAAALALMLAIALAASPLLTGTLRRGGPLADRALGLPGRLSRDSILRAPGRAAVTAAALAAAVTMVVGMASFIESERRTIFSWLDQAVNADLFVAAAPLGGSSTPVALDPALGDDIARIDGVEAVDRFRQVRIEHGGSLIALSSTDVPVYLRRAKPLFAPGSEPYDLMRMVGRDEVFVSDNFARRQKVRQGEMLRLRTPDGERGFLVVAIITDYTTDQGLVFMDRGTYRERFHDSAVDSFAVMVRDASSEAAVRAELERLEGGALFVQSNAEFKAAIRKLVDDFFATTYVMEAIAMLVGVLGVANTMIVTVLERRREIGVLRAVGATRRQIRRQFLLEAGTIGLAGSLLGLAGGAALAAITLVVSEATTGWSIPYVYEWGTALSVTVLATAAAIAAAWWPALGAARQPVATALAYE